MTPVVWVHGDCLSPRGPALAACPGAPALFVFDEALLAEAGVSLKRIVFLYECLLELPVTIRRGDVAAELLAFAREHGATEVVTVASPSPRFTLIRRAVEARLPVRALPLAPFVAPRRPPDLARFARYWRAVEADAMRPPDAQ